MKTFRSSFLALLFFFPIFIFNFFFLRTHNASLQNAQGGKEKKMRKSTLAIYIEWLELSFMMSIKAGMRRNQENQEGKNINTYQFFLQIHDSFSYTAAAVVPLLFVIKTFINSGMKTAWTGDYKPERHTSVIWRSYGSHMTIVMVTKTSWMTIIWSSYDDKTSSRRRFDCIYNAIWPSFDEKIVIRRSYDNVIWRSHDGLLTRLWRNDDGTFTVQWRLKIMKNA